MVQYYHMWEFWGADEYETVFNSILCGIHDLNWQFFRFFHQVNDRLGNIMKSDSHHLSDCIQNISNSIEMHHWNRSNIEAFAMKCFIFQAHQMSRTENEWISQIFMFVYLFPLFLFSLLMQRYLCSTKIEIELILVFDIEI